MPFWAKWGLSLAVAVGLIWIGWRYTAVLVTLHVLVCLVLVAVIMLQSGNAADLAGAFGGAGSQTAFGPRGAATFLSRATTWCAIVFMMTSLTLSVKRGPSEPRANAKASSGARKNSSGHSGADSGCAWPSPGTGSSAGANSATGAKPAARASQEITVLEQRRLRAISQTKSSALRIDVARSWRNWQTHQLEGLAVAIPWWFESTRPHYFFSHPARFWPDDFHS